MTPKEEAKKLVETIGESISKPHRGGYKYNIEQAKKCALIAVDKLIEVTAAKYWYDVKREIELL